MSHGAALNRMALANSVIFTDKALSEIRKLGMTRIAVLPGVPHHALINDYKHSISDDRERGKGRTRLPYAVKITTLVTWSRG